MRTKFSKALLPLVALFGAIFYLTGCATIGMDRATKVTDIMQELENDYQQATLQIDATNASLASLIRPGQQDPQQAYKDYTKEVNKMETLGQRLNKHTEEMQNRRDEYFEQWESSYANPDIQELSEQRRAELRAAHEKIPVASIGVKGSLQSYLTDTREIQRYLSNDLSPHGIESIKPVAHKAIRDGDRLQESIKPILTAIGQVKSVMFQSN